MMEFILGSYKKCGLRSNVGLILFIVLVFHESVVKAQDGSSLSSDDESHKIGGNHSERYKLLSFDFHHVEVPYVICLWILLASVAKIGFHLYDKLPHIFPESCLLITLGILVGVTLFYTGTADSTQYSLDANTFFLFLLPPIIYDAGYHMPNRAFFNNIGTILLLAVVNTLWNTVGIGLGLWGMSYLGWIHQKIGILHCFVFSALISAVDPVAVLAIFEEIQVNEILYIIVFGESLLNDGVTVVLYHMMEGFTEIGENNLEVVDFAVGFAQFFIVVLGGTLIGAIYGLVGAFITKYTDHVRVIEPLFIFVLGYLAYLTAESLHLSGILALTFGGIIMRHYTEANMAKKSTTTVKYFMKMMANISETIIFMFLGLSTVIDSHEWHLDFILFTILFCLVFRVTGVVFLSYMLNRKRLIRLSPFDQFIMSYGGLRGGIAFCLALLLNKQYIPEKAMFVSTTVVIVFFTVFIQGITIKPVVNALKVEKAEHNDPTMNEMIHKRFIDHLMAGVEDIVGKSGHNSIGHKFDYYNTKYLKPLLLREKPESRDASIVRTFTKLSMQDAKSAIKMYPISRDPSFAQLYSRTPSNLSLHRRAAAMMAQTDRDQETVINMQHMNPLFAKSTPDDIQHILEDSMFEPRSTWSLERRHTLAEIHNHPPFQHAEREQLRHLFTDMHRHGKNGVYSNGSTGRHSHRSKKMRKNVSFSSSHVQLSKQLSDVAEISGAQESNLESPPSSPPVVFTLGQPLKLAKTGSTADKPSSDKPDTLSDPTPSDPTPSEPIPSDPQMGKESARSPPPTTDHSSPPTTTNTNTTTTDSFSNNSAADRGTTGNTVPGSSSNDSVFNSEPVDISKLQLHSEGNVPPLNPNNDSKPEEKEDSENEESESNKEGTIAESSLPWRRQTTLPPVPSSVSLGIPDDENPLMSEAPSWADNLAYSHLTETGSPYHSPENTVTSRPRVTSPRPVFDIFTPSTPPPVEDKALHTIPPPPWSIRDRTVDNEEDEPIPSHSLAARDAGDKASCMLVSSHDLVPPSYHSCLQPCRLEAPSSRRHSEASSPVHFQFMEKPEFVSSSAIESQLIGIEEDYHHGMKERVSSWLATAAPGDEEHEDIDNELARKEEGERILESLRQKKEKWILGDVDDGTDADVESGDELDTQL